MGSSRYYSAVNVLLACILFQHSILISNAEANCDPKFGPDQKISVEYFYPYNCGGLDEPLCKVIAGSNGLISIIYRMGADVIGQDANGEPTCTDPNCIADNRGFACNYKFHQDLYNDCNSKLPPIDQQITDCINEGAADNILLENGTGRVNYGIDEASLPALVVNGVYDPNFTDYSFEGMKKYFCTGYCNTLPICGE